MDTVINSTTNADISEKYENGFFLIKVKIWALNFSHVY